MFGDSEFNLTWTTPPSFSRNKWLSCKKQIKANEAKKKVTSNNNGADR